MLEGESLDRTMLRRHHTLLIFNLIREAKRISRVDLAKMVQMSNTAVGNIIKDLINRNLVREVGFTNGNVGRKPTLLEINPDGALVIGMDLDIDKVNLGVVDLNGGILEKKQFRLNLMQTTELVIAEISNKINLLLSGLNKDVAKKIIGLGVSIPGLVSWPEGEIKTIPQFHWENINLRKHLEEKLNLSVYIDNNVKAQLQAEYLFGAAKDSKHAVCIHIGTGVGGAVIENGEMLRGTNNILGEIGHMIMDPGGLLCDCGRFGCLQTLICSNSLEKQLEKPIDEIIIGAKTNDLGAKKLIDRADESLALAIANVICLYNPEVVLLVGSMVEEREDLVRKVQHLVKKYIWSPLSNSYQIKKSELGDDAGIIGASALVLGEQLRSPFQKISEMSSIN
nr:ROK family protein [Fredinandcohnia onubensis]